MTTRPTPERIRTARAASILGVEARALRALCDRALIPGAARIGSIYTFCEKTLRTFAPLFEQRKAELLDSLKPARIDTVYVVRCGYRVKIGFTRNIAQRLHALKTANHRPLELITSWPAPQSEEKALHARFADLRVSGEWFALQKPIKEWLWTEHKVMVL